MVERALSCPVCGGTVDCRESLADEARLKARAREHLRRHDLSEPKRGIYTVKMVDDAAGLRAE